MGLNRGFTVCRRGTQGIGHFFRKMIWGSFDPFMIVKIISS